MKIGGEIIVLDRSYISNLLNFMSQSMKTSEYQKASMTAKTAIKNVYDSFTNLLTKMEVLQKDRAYIRIGSSAEATHGSYFECVHIKRNDKISMAEAVSEALNAVLLQSGESADVNLVFTRETDTSYDFVVSVKQY